MYYYIYNSWSCCGEKKNRFYLPCVFFCLFTYFLSYLFIYLSILETSLRHSYDVWRHILNHALDHLQTPYYWKHWVSWFYKAYKEHNYFAARLLLSKLRGMIFLLCYEWLHRATMITLLKLLIAGERFVPNLYQFLRHFVKSLKTPKRVSIRRGKPTARSIFRVVQPSRVISIHFVTTERGLYLQTIVVVYEWTTMQHLLCL